MNDSSDMIDVEQLVGAIEADLYGVRAALHANPRLRERLLRALELPTLTTREHAAVSARTPSTDREGHPI